MTWTNFVENDNESLKHIQHTKHSVKMDTLSKTINSVLVPRHFGRGKIFYNKTKTKGKYSYQAKFAVICEHHVRVIGTVNDIGSFTFCCMPYYMSCFVYIITFVACILVVVVNYFINVCYCYRCMLCQLSYQTLVQ